MKIRSLVTSSVAVAALVGASVAVAGPASAATMQKPKPASTAKCDPKHDDQWPDWVDGRPAGLDAGDNGGVYLWHDADGWHLVVTHRGDDKKTVTGTIETRGKIVDAHGVALERDDKLAVSKKGHRLSFKFLNYGHIDGLTFKTVCAPRLAFGFKTGGHRLAADRIVIGHEGRHAERDPLVISRSA